MIFIFFSKIYVVDYLQINEKNEAQSNKFNFSSLSVS